MSALAAVLLPSTAHAALIATWISPEGGLFPDPANWADGAVPGPGDVAVFDLAVLDPVSFDQSVTNAALNVVEGGVLFDLSGHTYTLTDEARIGMGYAFSPVTPLTLNTGVLEAGEMTIGQWGDAEVVVHAGEMNIGHLAVGSVVALGTLLLEDGSHLEADSAVVSAWADKEALVELRDASTALTNTLKIADSFNRHGVVRIIGKGASWINTAEVTMGESHRSLGLLEVTDGASFTSGPVSVIGGASTTLVAIGASDSGAPSTMNMENLTVYGYLGLAALDVREGAEVTIDDWLNIHTSQGHGTAHVSGTGSRLTAASLNMQICGQWGGSSISMNVTESGEAIFDAWASLRGDVLVADAGLIAAPQITISDGEAALDNGTLEADEVMLDAGGTLSGRGDVGANLYAAHGTLRPGGPGDPGGLITVAGDLVLGAEALLHVEAGGPAAGEYGTLHIGGEAGLEGTIFFTPVYGYEPAAGDQLVLLTAVSVSGEFTVLELAGSDLPHTLLYSTDSVVLHFGLPGDLTGDGAVGVDDLLMLLAAWGPCPDEPAGNAASCPADLNADGVVNVDDLLILLAHWTG